MIRWIDLPPVWLGLFAALAWIQSQLVPMAVFGRAGDAIGGLAVLTGIALTLLAIREFGRARTTVIPHQMPSAIVTTGIFAISRNPIYLGDTLILFGLVLWWDAVPSLLLVPVFMMVIHRRFILAEEARLIAAFPEEFEAYRRATGRWFVTI